MEERKVWVIGHKNPDTDSICAAITYSYLKNKTIENEQKKEYKTVYVPKRAGNISAETMYVLNRFGVEAPELATDVGTQIKDIQIRKTEGVSSHISMKKVPPLLSKLMA